MPITRAGWFATARLYRPIHWRLFGLAGVLMSAGAGFVFGWELVRQDGGSRGTTTSAPLPAPGWLPFVGAASIAGGIAGLIVVHLSAPAANGERLPEHLRRPVDERAWPAALRILTPFVAAMVAHVDRLDPERGPLGAGSRRRRRRRVRDRTVMVDVADAGAVNDVAVSARPTRAWMGSCPPSRTNRPGR